MKMVSQQDESNIIKPILILARKAGMEQGVWF
jgi:hypothetical protein